MKAVINEMFWLSDVLKCIIWTKPSQFSDLPGSMVTVAVKASTEYNEGIKNKFWLRQTKKDNNNNMKKSECAKKIFGTGWPSVFFNFDFFRNVLHEIRY